jgi:small subunit ribosomal protein S5
MQGSKGKMKPRKEKPEFDQHIVDLARVTRVTEGGKHMSFRACVVIGDRNGRVAYGVDKGPDVQIAVEKAVNQAKKNMIRVPILNETIPHRVEAKYKAAKVMLKPAPRGSGVIAGSAIRVILEMAGVPNASSKMLGKTSNKIANVKAVFKALEDFSVRSLNVTRKVKENTVIETVSEVAASEETPKKAPAKAPRAPRKKAEVKA